MKVVLIGAGNVATHLGKACSEAGHRVIQIYNRHKAPARVLAKKLSCDFTVHLKKISAEADLYIIALRDEAIPGFVKKFQVTKKIVVHTSGTVAIAVFGKRFSNCGILYPVQTFSVNRSLEYRDIPFCIESSNAATQRSLRAFVKSFAGNVYEFNYERRRQLHLAAVFANNFSNHMFTVAGRLLRVKNISFDVLRPLILETVMKIQKFSPAEMQTGPAIRGDKSTMREHLKMLKKNKMLAEIYRLVSNDIANSNR